MMSKGTVELVDVSNDLPGLISCPGLQKWKLLSKRGEWFSTHEQVPEALKQGLCATMFPPPSETAQELHLERCRRILPHHQDTGGFFVAAFHKLTNVPWQRKFPSLQAPSNQTAQPESSETSVESQLNVASGPSQVVNDCSKDVDMETTTLSVDVSKPEDIYEAEKFQTSSDCGNSTTSTSNKVIDAAAMVSKSIKVDVNNTCEENDLKDIAEGVEKKEEPFIFLTEDDPDWPRLKEYYGLKGLPVDLLLVRSHTAKKRKIYIVSRAVKELVLNQKQHVRIVNLGVRVFQRSEGRDVNCPLRLASEGLSALLPYLHKRRIYVTLLDMETLLRQFNPSSSLLSAYARSQLNNLVTGSVVFTYDPSNGGTKPEVESETKTKQISAIETGTDCVVNVCGWVGGSSARIMSNDADRMHYLLILGLARQDDVKVEKNTGRSSNESATERTVDLEKGNSDASDGSEEQSAGKADAETVDLEFSDFQSTVGRACAF
jgi:tRNA (cytosine34-C5)-methyltransferase